MRLEPLDDGLRVLAPAKLNLYLEVGAKRPDGYHDVDSIFQAITLHDEIEFRRADGGRLELEEVGIAEAEKNLVYRAAWKLRERFFRSGPLPGARIRLRKRIPEGAGLGGGSSDAAASLIALSIVWGIPARPEDLLPLAAELGSDVPFFLVGGTARCCGRGERVESWADAFDKEDPFHYVLVYPRVKVSTKLVYEALDAVRGPGSTLTPSSPLDSMPFVDIRAQLRCGKLFFNRFESVVYEIFPELRKLHDFLMREPFLGVLMSGSGSTIYGVCQSAEDAQRIAAGLRGRLGADVYTASSERSHSGLKKAD